MIYLDYAANTPVSDEVLKTFCEVSRKYTANPNSSHRMGLAAKEYIDNCTKSIVELLRVKTNEIIYTASASEANNLAIKGIARQYKKNGKHIITTYLEHSSVNGAISALINEGFEVDYVNLNAKGQVDTQHLKELLREDTVLVSLCWVDSEVGIIQNIDEIGKLLKNYPHCHFHTDATQAVGKIPLSFENVDLATFAPHKFYGLTGCGILFKKEKLILEPLIHGGISTTPFRSGTPDIGQIGSVEKALFLALSALSERFLIAKERNMFLRQELQNYQGLNINSPVEASPFILNISLPGVKTELLKDFLNEKGIYLSTKSACCAPNTASRPVFALTGDKKVALATLRISLSHLTTENDLKEFLLFFEEGYKKFNK